MYRKVTTHHERRVQERRAFQHYMQFKNDRTGELVGDLADISRRGFRLEAMNRVPINAEIQFRVDLPPDVPGRTSIVFTAQSRWIRPHPIDPRMYVIGYEIQRMDPADGRSFTFVFDRYGSTGPAKPPGNDYVWQG